MEEVTICIPAHNEEEVILSTLDVICEVCNLHPEYVWRILVVDSASSDDTVGFVKSYPDPRVEIVRETKKGKGRAVISGAQHSNTDYFVYLDADISASPHQIPSLLSTLKEGADVVAGSRFLNEAIVHRSAWRSVTSKLFHFYAELLVPTPVLDSQCSLKVMNKRGIEILSSCTDTGWFFDREFLAKAKKRNLSIVEVPIFWEEFRYPNRKSKLHVLRAGMQSIVRLWSIRKSVKNF